jgi:hypothetical protein
MKVLLRRLSCGVRRSGSPAQAQSCRCRKWLPTKYFERAQNHTNYRQSRYLQRVINSLRTHMPINLETRYVIFKSYRLHWRRPSLHFWMCQSAYQQFCSATGRCTCSVCLYCPCPFEREFPRSMFRKREPICMAPSFSWSYVFVLLIWGYVKDQVYSQRVKTLGWTQNTDLCSSCKCYKAHITEHLARGGL